MQIKFKLEMTEMEKQPQQGKEETEKHREKHGDKKKKKTPWPFRMI